ncbi:MAG TPA: PAS domain S-box protein [Spirochaetota bacterium]|nr:PAS domain S-box protein [Spirochaetota bacterium]HPU89428.1 PAS domain S-box protein [Spirochaetota bacterium]
MNRVKAALSGTIVGLVFIALMYSSSYAVEPIRLTERTLSGSPIGRHVEYCEDTTGALSLQSLLENTARGTVAWKASAHESLGFGFTNSAYWIRFTVVNERSEPLEWYFDTGYPLNREVDLYVPRGGGFILKQEGVRYVYGEREFDHHNIIFPLHESPGSHTYYLRVRSHGSITLPLRAWSRGELYSNSFLVYMVQGIFLGMLVILALSNLLIFALSRDVNYIFSALFYSAFVMASLTFTGIGYRLFWPDTPWFNYGIAFWIFMTLVFASLLTRSYLGLQERSARLNRLVIAMAVLYFTGMALSWAAPYRIIVSLVAVSILVSLAVFLFVGIVLLVRRVREAYFHTLAWIVMLAFCSLTALKSLGVVPGGFIATYGFEIGVTSGAFLFSLGLSDRINTLKNALATLNADLEQTVDERTEALHRSEAKYSSILEVSKIGYYEVDINGAFLDVNRPLAEFLGYTVDELIGMNYARLVDEKNALGVYEFFNRIHRREMDRGMIEIEVIARDGSRKCGDNYVSRIENDAGGTIGFRAVTIDASDRREAEDELRRSEEKYRHFIENANEVIYKSDWRGNFLFANEAFSRLLGYTRDEILQMNYLDVIPPERRDEEFAFYKRQLQGRIPASFRELPVVAKTGAVVWVEQNVKSVFGDDGRIVEFDAIVRDITERKIAQDALRDIEQGYRTILDNVADAIGVCDFSGTILYMNSSGWRMTGYEQGESLNFLDIIHPDQREALAASFIRQQMENIPFIRNEFLMVRKDGTSLWCDHISTLTRDAAGKRILCGIGRDISESRRAKQELEDAKEAAEAASLAKSRFLANMSHELRTPLNAINGIIDLLQYGSFERDEEILAALGGLAQRLRDLPDGDARDQAERLRTALDSLMRHLADDGNCKRYILGGIRGDFRALRIDDDPAVAALFGDIDRYIADEETAAQSSYRRIKESGEYLLGLIDMVLNLAKIETGNIEIVKSEVRLQEMIGSVLRNAQSYAASKGKAHVAIVTELEDGVPDTMVLDNQKTHQALLNYLSNAVKFTEAGSVTLAVSRIGGRVRFAVRDTGIGIRDEDRVKIFVEFERTESARYIEGTGLGLAITKRLIELQGGAVGFESQYGTGSVFWFELPV